MIFKLCAPMSLLITGGMLLFLGPWAWLFGGIVWIATFVLSVAEALRFHRWTRELASNGWHLTFADRALTLGTVHASDVRLVPSRLDCLALPGYDAEKPDIENIMKFLREHPKGK